MRTFAEFEAQVSRHGLTVREYQLNLVAMGTHGLTEAEREAIADRCIDTRKRGDENVTVWHHAAAYFGTPCQCVMCANHEAA
jgi:hypothetical protein